MFEDWSTDKLYDTLDEIREKHPDKKYPEVYYDMLEEIEIREI